MMRAGQMLSVQEASLGFQECRTTNDSCRERKKVGWNLFESIELFAMQSRVFGAIGDVLQRQYRS
jgi:hypothetical protein